MGALPSISVLIFLTTKLNTPMQAVATEIFISFTFPICNIYSSRSHNLNNQLLSNLFDQLPSPCLIFGDFNAYSIHWGSPSSDSRSRIIESFLLNNRMNLLNDGSPSRITQNSETAINLSICSPSIAMKFNWYFCIACTSLSIAITIPI